MRTQDACEFGIVVDKLIGHECDRTLATNSIKFRFDTKDDPRGLYYLWIDPPWTLYKCDVIVTSSHDYRHETFREWSRLCDPLNQIEFVGWEHRDGRTVFQFAGLPSSTTRWRRGSR